MAIKEMLNDAEVRPALTLGQHLGQTQYLDRQRQSRRVALMAIKEMLNDAEVRPALTLGQHLGQTQYLDIKNHHQNNQKEDKHLFIYLQKIESQ
jgi:hypothetical protein